MAPDNKSKVNADFPHVRPEAYINIPPFIGHLIIKGSVYKIQQAGLKLIILSRIVKLNCAMKEACKVKLPFLRV